ncbi:MAG: trehalose synthase [Thermoleophilia bacterium]|nr:trehalose synthase [Thermoleophilia bacterium]MCZ4495879.1 trehalose synthase [Thermoleophilia bacterium]
MDVMGTVRAVKTASNEIASSSAVTNGVVDAGKQLDTAAAPLSAAADASQAAEGARQLISNGMPSNPNWIQEATFYQVYPRAFLDTTGSGQGDLRGVINRLDHIQDMGIDAIHLNPFFKSPMRDGGYDISDFRGVDPSLGTIADAKELIDEAHKRGIRVMTENVANHTSNMHPWFTDEVAQLKYIHANEGGHAALEALDKNDLKYVWDFTSEADGPPKLWSDTRTIFEDYEDGNWTWVPEAQGWNWHRFFNHQPDLNWDNPVVVKDMIANSDYWFDLGVDAQRMDAVPYLFERTGTFPDGRPMVGENLPETHAMLKKMRAHTDAKYDSRAFVGEANMMPEETTPYFGSGPGDELHALYNFPEMPRKYLSMWSGDKKHIAEAIEMSKGIPKNSAWLTFNRNHDEMTLEKVPEQVRLDLQEMFRKGNPELGIKPDPDAPRNLGISLRQWELLGENDVRNRQMNALLYTMPGTPVLYNGDEIGMRSIRGMYDRDGVRTPMQWDDSVNGGFSSADPKDLFIPSAVNDAKVASDGVNVAAQRLDPNSTLNHVKKLIAMRHGSEALQKGAADIIPTSSDHVSAIMRSTDNEQVLVLNNVKWTPESSSIDLPELVGRRVEVLDSNNPDRVISTLPGKIDLASNESLTLRILPDEA